MFKYLGIQRLNKMPNYALFTLTQTHTLIFKRIFTLVKPPLITRFPLTLHFIKNVSQYV